MTHSIYSIYGIIQEAGWKNFQLDLYFISWYARDTFQIDQRFECGGKKPLKYYSTPWENYNLDGRVEI